MRFPALLSRWSIFASPLSCASRAIRIFRSSSLRNLAVSGQSTVKNFDAAPMTTVASPSMMKILFVCHKRERSPREPTGMSDKDAPSPRVVAPNITHVGDSISEEARDRACHNTRREEQRETPLQLKSRVVHADQVNTTFLRSALERGS